MKKHIKALENRRDWLNGRLTNTHPAYGTILDGELVKEKEALDWALDRLSAEALIPKVDLTTDLKVGDEVVSLIEYMGLEKGARGVVKLILDRQSYPVDVQFPKGTTKGYTPDDVLGFDRNELGKVG